jgi:hypothetical protein
MVEDAISLAAALTTIWAPIAQRTRCGAGHSPAEAQLNVEFPRTRSLPSLPQEDTES